MPATTEKQRSSWAPSSSAREARRPDGNEREELEKFASKPKKRATELNQDDAHARRDFAAGAIC
jgi:hypothetical protein